jgi:pimeloyl-[acyl-carrier protein] methyl ester esterase
VNTGELAQPARMTSSQGLVYERRGNGGRPVVLLHGWCLSGRLWTYEQADLAASFDVITPDLPGFGRSDGLAGPFVYERYVSDIQDLLAEADLHDAVLVGFAFGAAVAMGVAARDASRLRGLVLVGTPSAAHFPADRMVASMRRDWPQFARRSAEVICKKPQSDATLQWLGNMFGSTPLPVAMETAALLGIFEPLPLAPRVHVPTLFVHGAEDHIAPLSIAEDCVAQCPQARLEAVDDCGHLVPFDQRERFRAALHGFLSES